MMDEYKKALIELVKACPSSLECNHLHHARYDQHAYNEPCPVMERYLNALEEAQNLLNQ